jgi:hypothetical protein
VEFKDVDNSSAIAGGVTTANFPQAARNFRRSAAEAASASFIGLGNCRLDMELSFLRLERTSQTHRSKQFRVLISTACLPRKNNKADLAFLVKVEYLFGPCQRKTRRGGLAALE